MSNPNRRSLLGLSVALALTTVAAAQYNERASLAGSGAPDVDCTGRSIKNPRVRAVHTEDPSLEGGTAYFFEKDPFLAYQLGRNLNFREFRERDGVFSEHIAQLGGPMPDGTTAKITANNQVSCSGCHNLPPGNPGGGVNFQKDSGFGRNSPHYYGAGITEMLAIQTRAKIMRQIDTDGDGWVSVAEASGAPHSVRIRTSDFGPYVDYGSPRLRHGKPRFNNIVRVWYVDDQGRFVPGADSVDEVSTFGYNLEIVVYGWGQGPGRSALNPTNRAFLWDPWVTHGGLDSHDPSGLDDPDGDGVSEPTLAGAIQFPATHRAPDRGQVSDPRGFSRDDPDGDGYLTELSDGDLDLGEWFMLNAPRPAFRGTQWEYNVGVQVMTYLRCTDCHVANWKIEARDVDGRPHAFSGDRRLFDFEVDYDRLGQRLEGTLVPLYTKNGDSYERRFGSFLVEGIFTDLLHHDMGPGFKEDDFGGNQNTLWRTAPLWGVGSGFPWGHDGQSLSLDDVIRRHGGEAKASRRMYERSAPFVREFLLDFLQKLVLYDIETLPADIDGDGRISKHFRVAGVDTGGERFNAEWLFRVPVSIQGPFRNTDGVRVTSFAATNIDAAYGLQLPLRVDSDLDGWPDVWDAAPYQVGYKDGVN